MFDVYVYDASGELVGVDPSYTADVYKEAAAYWIDRGCNVKVVNIDDGVLVYTLG